MFALNVTNSLKCEHDGDSVAVYIAIGIHCRMESKLLNDVDSIAARVLPSL